MKKIVVLLCVAFIYSNLFGQDAASVYKKCVGSTVTIETDAGLGSGFFVGTNIIVTNYHVIEGATTAYCYLNNDKTKYKIKGYLAADRSVDLILLKVETLDKPALKFATGNVEPGLDLFVIGSPKGLPATISDGIVSGLRSFEGYKLIQMTAPISPGSSGGPVLNKSGELIGVSVSQLEDGQNINFAIPLSYVELLISYKKDDPISITNLYSSVSNDNSNDANYYEKDKTYEIGVFKKGTPELSLDYVAHFGDYTSFYFTYDMTNSNKPYQTIYMEDYRLVDIETGEIYYAQGTDLSDRENSRVIYKGTKSRFLVYFERLPGNVKNFSLMEGECSAESFCFLNINLNNYSTTEDVNWELYKNNESEGTISFYLNQNMGGAVDLYIEEYYAGSIKNYFMDKTYVPTCGAAEGAMLTFRFRVGTYNYYAKSPKYTWKGQITVTKEGCTPLKLYVK